MQGNEITEEVTAETREGGSASKKVFVAGSTGSTGKRIVNQLLAKGFAVKAGVRDVEKGKATLPQSNSALEIVSTLFLKHLY